MLPSYNFRNALPDTYSICGYKYYEEVGGLGIPGWTVRLYKDVDGSWEPQAETTTDACGHYCFEGLEAGTYLVKEVMQTHWTPVGPTQHLVTLPNGEAVSYDFVNERTPYDDTVWAYGGEGIAKPNNKVKGNPSSAWGWTNYFDAEAFEFGPVVMDLYAGAGQNDITKGMVVGNVTVAWNGTCVTVTYAIDPDLPYDYTLTEAHLWIGKDPLPTWEEVTRGRSKGKKPGTTTTTIVSTAAPGQFPYNPEIADDGLSATFKLCEGDEGVDFVFADGFWVAAHGVVQWYKVPAPVCDLTGDWDLVFQFNGPAPWLMTIITHDSYGSLAGEVSGYGQTYPFTGSCDYPLITLEIDADSLTIDLEGTVTCCSEMSGTSEFSTGQTGILWTATRVVSP